MSKSDYLIIGAGLQGGLIALALRHFQPEAKVTLVDRTARPGGNHTWSFHSKDMSVRAEPFVRPLIASEWAAYQVRFPDYARLVPSSYHTITSDRFATILENSGCTLRLNTDVKAIHPTHVQLADDTELSARCVLDARGPTASIIPNTTGFQKFVGLEIETDQPWPEISPTIMDATVPQDDGFRFVYVLPFTPHRVLIEDTYFSDTSDLNKPLLRERIAEYAYSRGIRAWRVVREESGILPMPWNAPGVTIAETGPFRAGYAGGWFHPATGYSFPLAVRVAQTIATVSADAVARALQDLCDRVSPRQRFSRFLNRLLFTLVVPEQRWQVFRRLYRAVPDAALHRFYALDFGLVDAARMVIGWPPPVALSRLIHRPEKIPCPSLSP